MKIFIGVLALALAVQGAAVAQTTSPSPRPQPSGTMQGGGAVPLVPVGKKGAGGSAVLAQQGSNIMVTLTLPQGYTVHRAIIASGSCKSSGAASVTGGDSYDLNVSNTNQSTNTTIPNASLEKLVATPHVILVQGTAALCGDLSSLLPPQKP